MAASTVAQRVGDFVKMSAYTDQASGFVDPDDVDTTIAIASARGMQAGSVDDWDAATRWLRHALELVEQLPDDLDLPRRLHGGPNRAKYMMMVRNNLAFALLHLGRNQEAVVEAEAALAGAAGVFENAINLAAVLDTCGQIYLALSDLDTARTRFIAALSHAVANANNNMAIAPLFGLARTAAEAGYHDTCLTFMAAARRAAKASGAEWLSSKNYPVESIVDAETRSRAAFDEGTAKVAWERGLNMDIQAALTFAQNVSRTSTRPALSPRECDVVRLVSQGLPDKEIARRLSISSRTVEVHLARVRQKLGLHNRAEVAVWAVTNPGWE